MSAPVFFLIAGEASGDILGAHVMRALKQKLKGRVRFAGIGGPHMQAEGIDLLFPHTELMHFGVIEVLRHIPRLLKRIHQTANEVRRLTPDALITIDSPDFCFRVAKLVKKSKGKKIPLIHYVAPTVWAWRPGRAKKIAKFLDHLLVLLPFEPPYFTREGLPCTFVGHPIVETNAGHGDALRFRSERNLAADIPLLTMLPGSRTSEITRLMPVFRQTTQRLHDMHPGLHVVVPVVPHLKERIAADMATWNVPHRIVEDEQGKYDAFAASTAALACSGTVALELALAHLPTVIAYKINNLTALLYRRFLLTHYVNLINIMHDKVVMPELLQENCTPDKLTEATDLLLRDASARQEQIALLSTAAAWLGQGQFIPSERAAETILSALAQKTTVMQVVPALVTGGVERGTVETVAALTAAGFRAIVASSGGPMVREVEQAGGIHITLPLASKNPLTICSNITLLSEAIEKYGVNIIHARSRAPAWSAYYAAQRMRIPFVTTFHSAYGAGSKLKRWYNSAMAKGTSVIAISAFVAEYAERTYGIARTLIRTIPRGVDIAQFDPDKIEPQRIEALRQIWGIKDGKPVILMPGRFTRWKGQSVLVQALAQLERRDFVCIIVGGGKDSSYGKEVAQEIRATGLDKNIFLFDTCRDMAAAYKLANTVIVPSTRPEGFGRVVIEAQAMGTVVIATDHGGAKETVIPEQTGFLVPPSDALTLSRAIEKVLNMPAEARQKMTSRSIAHIRKHFTTANMTSQTLAVYRELLPKGTKP